MYSYFTRRPGINAVYLGFAGMDEANYGRCFAASDEVEIQCFRIWAKRMHARYPPGSAHQFLFAGPPLGNPNGPPWFNASQTSWLMDHSGNIAVDHVCKLEAMEECWAKLQPHICGFAGKDYWNVVEKESEGGESTTNSNPHAPYPQFYDRPTEAIIAEYASADLANFGYVLPSQE